MSLLRATRRPIRLQIPFLPPATTSLLAKRHYAGPNVASTKADDASDKSKKDAQPKILSTSPPKDAEASEDVKQHNREMDQRADRPSEKVTDKDVENDKVHKGFWSGEITTGANEIERLLISCVVLFR